MGTVLEYKENSEAIGQAYRTGGFKAALRVFAKNLKAASQEASFIPSWFIASIYGYMGDKDRAFASLEKAFESRDGIDRDEPMWDPLAPIHDSGI